MTHYLYVPFKKRVLSPKQKSQLEQWLKLEQEKHPEIVVCYFGEKKLKNITENATIDVLLPGMTGPISPLAKGLPSELNRSFNSLSGHLRLKDDTTELLVPEVADHMIEDGLFDNVTGRALHIKLFFPDVSNDAKILAESFNNSLQKNPKYQDGTIRLDYYQHNPRQQHKTSNTKYSQLMAQSDEVKRSIFNKDTAYPKMSVQQVDELKKQYNDYKSARFCGLSGVLGLNGFFSSDASDYAIKYLSNQDISDQQRFAYASLFIKKFPDNQLGQMLKPVIEESLLANQLDWTDAQSQTTLQL